MTRVLLLFTTSQLGGAERSLSRMAFASSPSAYVLGTLGNEGPWCEWVRRNGFEPRVYGTAATTLQALLNLRQDVKRLGIDVVYVCGLRASLLVRLLLITLPAVGFVHGVRWNPDSNDRLDRLFRGIERVSHRIVDAYVTNSAVARDTLVSRCGIPEKRIAVIYNGLSGFDEPPPKSDEHAEVLTVANLKAGKGHLAYLQAISRITNQFPDARFIFVGEDELNGQVQKTVDSLGLDEVVRCVGFQDEVSAFYQRASVFVLPSCSEGCPTSVLEAMNHSLPTVAFAVDGIPELIESGQHGILVPENDFTALVDAVVTLLIDKAQAAKLGAQAHERVQKRFRLTTMVDEHARLFSELSSSPQ